MPHTASSILSDETLNRIMAIESRGKLKAKAPTSSALGPFQFLNGTWLGVVKRHRPDLFSGRTRQAVLALRTDPTVGIELGARFTEDNAAGLGHGYTDGDLYLAHFLGLGAARKFFRAPADASAERLAGPDAVRANRSILAGKTAGQVRAWAQHSMVTRWDQAGHVDWVKQFYDPNSPLAGVTNDGEVDPEHDAPVKHEENFADQADDPPEDVPVPRARPVQPDEDSTVQPEPSPSFVDTAKSMFQSKIAWLAGLLGLGGAGSGASSDPSVTEHLTALVTKPAFLFMLVVIITAGAIIYFRWRDHGRGAVQ